MSEQSKPTDDGYSLDEAISQWEGEGGYSPPAADVDPATAD